jgi:hypothetical protein
MITEATTNGALDEQIVPHSRDKDASSMRGYPDFRNWSTIPKNSCPSVPVGR